MSSFSSQADVSPEHLIELRNALSRYTGAGAEALSKVKLDFARRRRVLAAREDEAQEAVIRCRLALEALDEDEDPDECEDALAEAEQSLAAIRRWIHEVDKHYAWFAREAARFQVSLEEQVPAAARYLDGSIRHLQDYAAIRLDPDGMTSSAAEPAAPKTAIDAGAAAASAAGGAETTQLTAYTLPRGFRWVLLSEIDTSRGLEGVSSPEDFRKVSYDSMCEGALRLRGEVLPQLQGLDAAQAKDYFRALDASKGVPYSEGLLSVYEAFFGQHDFIYLVRRPDTGKLDIVNGRHRVKTALDLGWDAIPAQVKD